MMLLPGVAMLVIFSILPMVGIVMAFQNFVPAKGVFASNFVGLKHFRNMLVFPEVKRAFYNTIIIAVSKIILGIIVPVSFAVLLSELKFLFFKRVVQTIVYMPHFLSWVILALIFQNIFSFTGIANQIAMLFGGGPILFLVNNTWFRPIIIGTDVWKTFGFGAIIYLAAISNVDVSLYEAASVDGANRWQKIWSITLPSIRPTIILMATLSLGSVLNAGFDQIFNMYSPLVYETGDIIDTYVFRMGLVQMQFSFGTAVGLLRSVISFILMITAYKLAARFAGYTIY